jgi:hypothetical protein
MAERDAGAAIRRWFMLLMASLALAGAACATEGTDRCQREYDQCIQTVLDQDGLARCLEARRVCQDSG